MVKFLKRFGRVFLVVAIAALAISWIPQDVSKTESEEIPIQLRNNLILVKGSINETEPVTFLLDTGCTGTVITKKLAKALGLKKVSTSISMGLKTSKLHTVDSISVNGLSAPPGIKTVIGGDFTMTRRLQGITINGIIGAGFFANSKLIIDYKERFVTLARGSEPEHKLDFELIANLIMLNARINDSEPLPYFLLDTGASLSVLSKEVISQLGLGPGRPMPFMASVDKPTFSHLVRVKSLRLGKTTVNDLTCLVMKLGRVEKTLQMMSRGTRFGGILGYSFLSQFKITIDYPRQRLILTPYKHAKTREERFTINQDTFTAHEIKMSFERPNETWEFVTETPLREIPVILNKKDTSAKVNLMTKFSPGVKLENLTFGIEWQLERKIRRYHKLSGELTNVSGQLCYIIDYTGAAQGKERRYRQVYFKPGDIVCCFSFAALKDEFESVEAEFEKLIKSIKFLKR